MTEGNGTPEIIITPDEEGRIRTSVVGFIRGEFSETDLLDFFARFKQEKIAATANMVPDNAVPEKSVPEKAVPETISESEASGDFEKSLSDSVSVSDNDAAASENTMNSAAARSSGFSREPAVFDTAIQRPLSSSEMSSGSEDNDATEPFRTRPSPRHFPGSAPETTHSRSSWSASELITGKLLTGVGAALFLAIGFVLVARNVHFSMGPGFKFAAMLAFSLAAIVWGFFSGKKSDSAESDFSAADVFRVTVSGIGFTLLYVVISLGCFYFDLLPPWLWRPFLLCWCLAMLGASVYRHHIFTLLAQIGILVSFPIALDCLGSSLEGQVLLALMAQVPFHIYGVFRKEPVVCYNSVISFFILMCALASDDLDPDHGARVFFTAEHLMNLTIAAAGVVIGFLAITGASGRRNESENTGFIRACSVVNVLAFGGITVICTFIIHFLFYKNPVPEAAFILAVYAGDSYFINRISPSRKEQRRVQGLLSAMLELWIVICLVAVPEIWLLSVVLACFHFVCGLIGRNRAEIVPAAFFLMVFAALYVSHDGLLFPGSVTPVIWKAALVTFLCGVLLYSLIVRNRAECRQVFLNGSFAGTGPGNYRTVTFREFSCEDPDTDTAEKYQSTPAGLAFSKNCFQDESVARLVSAVPEDEAVPGHSEKSVKDRVPGQGATALSGSPLPKVAIFAMLLIMLCGFVIGNGSLLMLHVYGKALSFSVSHFIPELLFVIAGVVFWGIVMLFRDGPEDTAVTRKSGGIFRTIGLLTQSLHRHAAELLTCLAALLILAFGALGSAFSGSGFSDSAVLMNTGILVAGSVMLVLTFSGVISRFGRGIGSGSLVIPGTLYVLAVALGFSAGYFFHPVSSWPFFAALFFVAVYDAALPRLLRGIPDDSGNGRDFISGPLARNELSGFRRGIRSFSIVLAVLFYFNCADFTALSSELGSAASSGLVFGCYTLLLGYFCFGDFFRKNLRCPDTLSLAAVSLTVFVTLFSYGLLRRGVIPTLILYPLALSFYVLWQRTGVRFLRALSLILITAAVFLMYTGYYHDLSPETQKFFNTLHFAVIGQTVQTLFVSGRNRSLRLASLLGTVALPALICFVLGVKTWELFPMYWWLLLAAMVLFAVLRRDALYVVAGIALVYLYSYRDLSPVLREVFNTGSLIFLTVIILFARRVPVSMHALHTLGILAAFSAAEFFFRGRSTGFPVFWELVLTVYAVLTCWNMKWNTVLYGGRTFWEDCWGVADGTVNRRRGIYFLAGILVGYCHYYQFMPDMGREIFNTFSIISGNLLLLLWFRKEPPVLRLSVFGLLTAAYIVSGLPEFWDSVSDFLTRHAHSLPAEPRLFPVLWGAVLAGYAVLAGVFRRPLYVLAGFYLVYLVWYGDFSDNWKILFNTGVYAAVCLMFSWRDEKSDYENKTAFLGFPASFLPVIGITLVFSGYHLAFEKPWLYILPLLFSTVYGVARRDYVMFAGAMVLAAFMTLAALWDLPGFGFAAAAVMVTLVMSGVLFVGGAGGRNAGSQANPVPVIPALALGLGLAVAAEVLFYRHPLSVSVSAAENLLPDRVPYFAVLALYSGALLFIRRFSDLSGKSGNSGVSEPGSGFLLTESGRCLGTAGIFATPGFGRSILMMTLAVSAGGILGALGFHRGNLSGMFGVMLMLTGMGTVLLVLIIMKFEVFTAEDAALFDDCQRHRGLMSMTAESSGFFLRKIIYAVNFGLICYVTWFALDVVYSRYLQMTPDMLFFAVPGVSLIYFLTAPMMFRSQNFRKLKIYYCMAKLFVLVYVIAAIFRLEEGVTLTVAWLFVATLLLFFGFFFNVGEVRKTGLGVCMLCVLKLLLVDLSYHGDIAKAFSYLLAGVILLGASFVYNYFSRRISRDAEDRR